MCISESGSLSYIRKLDDKKAYTTLGLRRPRKDFISDRKQSVSFQIYMTKKHGPADQYNSGEVELCDTPEGGLD